jgi:hypothetical protein
MSSISWTSPSIIAAVTSFVAGQPMQLVVQPVEHRTMSTA